MSPRVTIVDDSNIEHAAEVLAECEVGAVPVRGAVVGHLRAMLTDLGIVVRLVANGLRGSPSRKPPPTTKSGACQDDSVDKPQRP
jgi:CBS domain-containing protein